MKSLVRLLAFMIVVFIIAFYAISKLPKDFKIVPQQEVFHNQLITAGLKVGSTGEEVKIIQAALSTDKNIYPSGLVTGYYGELTKNAVSNFQKKYQIPQSGEVDEATAAKFNEVFGDRDKSYYLGLVPTQPVIQIQVDKPINGDWGKAVQLTEHSWTMQVGLDPQMATPQEIFDALNNYRKLHGRNTLNWDDRLATYASSRARYFTQIKDLDEHAGFAEFVKDENNVRSLGFWSLGENSSYGYRLTGTHLIEWVYAGDKPHDDNQLNPDWTHVGIGVDGYQTDLIFGGNQI